MSLPPDERKRIEEEEKIRLETRRADRGKNQAMGCFGCLGVIVIVIVISWISSFF